VLVHGQKLGLERVCDYKVQSRSVRRVGPKPSEGTLTSCKGGLPHLILVRSALAWVGGWRRWDDFPQKVGEVVFHTPRAFSFSSLSVLERLLSGLQNQ